jgi:hypothetical protein
MLFQHCCISCVKAVAEITGIFEQEQQIQLSATDIYLFLLLLLFTAIGFSPGDSSPYTSTHNTNVFTQWQ